jgi:hypothetical protein
VGLRATEQPRGVPPPGWGVDAIFRTQRQVPVADHNVSVAWVQLQPCGTEVRVDSEHWPYEASQPAVERRNLQSDTHIAVSHCSGIPLLWLGVSSDFAFCLDSLSVTTRASGTGRSPPRHSAGDVARSVRWSASCVVEATEMLQPLNHFFALERLPNVSHSRAFDRSASDLAGPCRGCATTWQPNRHVVRLMPVNRVGH